VPNFPTSAFSTSRSKFVHPAVFRRELTEEFMIGKLVSHYEIVEKLGEGGMSQNGLRAFFQRAVAILRTPAFSAGGWKARAL